MRGAMLPLFPLQVVLFPRTPLPLHIFEERYKEMIGECLAGGLEFGVVLAQGKGILRAGCTASIESVLNRYEDGRLDILTRGQRRFQIQNVDTERSFLRAEIEYFDDIEDGLIDVEHLRRAVRANTELRRNSSSEEAEPDLQDPQASFQLAQISPDLEFRQLLLAMRSEPDRMSRVADHMENLLVRQRMQERMRNTARTNGHGNVN
jgi:Lon protease-like protein